jgi:putative hydrolase of the HAD superfamily
MLSRNVVADYLKPLKPIPTTLKKTGKKLPGIKCVLFDIYGTLFISGSGDISLAQRKIQYVEKIKQLLVKFRIHEDPQVLMNKLFKTIDRVHQRQNEKGIAYPEVEIDRIWMSILDFNDNERIRLFALEYELIVNPVYPMPHLHELISTCRDKKIVMGLISNAQFYTQYLFKWFLGSGTKQIGFHPELTILSYKLGCAKPSSLLFDTAAKKLKAMDIPNEAVLFLGNDMLNDIYPAQQTGFKTALFAGDRRSLRLRESDIRCKNLSPDLVLTGLMQIFEFI